MQNSRIYPKWEDIEKLKDPLTEGELYFAKYLDNYLPKEWEIYIQPYLNGDRPDVVILQPRVGLMVFEVKDWNLKIYNTEEKEFYNKKTNQKGIYYKSYVLDKNHQKQSIPNPIRQIERYRSNLLLYIPRLANAIDDNFKRIAVLKIGLYFHNSITREAQNFIPNFKEKYCLVFGRDMTTSENIDKIVPDVNRSQSYFMDREWANEIRFWLKPPYHAIEQGQKIVLSKEQKRHIAQSPNQHQRLRGVAGSGKTLVIAQRAADSASQGKKILILTYNITLWHYIRDAISRARYGFEWEQIELTRSHPSSVGYAYESYNY
ncbi:NERD domain-containing protein [bacterium]|nr:NERD domain-containing protein [bacterium]MBU1957758.1 NERD domain-containing protein [bacterium]